MVGEIAKPVGRCKALWIIIQVATLSLYALLGRVQLSNHCRTCAPFAPELHVCACHSTRIPLERVPVSTQTAQSERTALLAQTTAHRAVAQLEVKAPNIRAVKPIVYAAAWPCEQRIAKTPLGSNQLRAPPAS